MGYRSIDEMRTANEAIGHCWFSRESMEAFNTTIHGDVIGGRYFITSDYDSRGNGGFTIRECVDGDVHTERSTRMGEFDDYAEAAEAARELARSVS